MSKDDEIKARGQLLTDYVEAKQRSVTLQNELIRAGEALKKLGDGLRTGQLDIAAEYQKYISVETIQALITDYQQTEQRKTEARDGLKRMGADVV